MWRQAADFHMRHGQPKVAANSLEELVRSNPNDKKAIAQLSLAYAQVRMYNNLLNYIKIKLIIFLV